MIDQDVMSRVAAYRGNPAQLQQRYAMNQDLLDLLALQKIKSEKEAAARQMQLQMSQTQAANGEAPMTVAQQREKEVMDMTKRELAQQRGDTLNQQAQQKQAQFNKLMGGLAAAPGAQAAAQPKAMAAGGIVAFDGGGSTDKEVERILRKPPRERTPEENAALERAGIKLQRQQIPEDSAIRRADTAIREAGAGMRGALSGGTNVLSEEELAARPAAGGALNERIMRAMGLGQTMPAPAAPAAPAGPDNRALLNQADADLRALPAAAQPPAPPKIPRPPMAAAAAPAAPAAPAPGIAGLPAAAGAPAAGPLGAPAMPAAPKGLRESIEADVAIDPAARQKTEEERIAGKLAISPEERAAMEQANEFRRRQFQEQYDPERQRREGIKQFLIGAGGRRYGEFGGGAQAAMGYDAAQRAAKLKEFEDMQKGIMEPFAKQRDITKLGIEGGLKGLEAASAQRRTGQTAGANVYSTESQAATAAADRTSREREKALDREVKKLEVQAQQAATAASREGTDFARLQGHLNMIITNRARAVEAVKKRYAPQLAMVEMGLQANPKDKTLLARRDRINADMELEIDAESKVFDDAKALVESHLYGKAGAGETGGYTVRKKEPTK